MNKQAVSKFLGISPGRLLGSIDPDPIEFKPNSLICADIMYIKDNTFEDVMKMCKVPNESYSNARKIFICKDTVLGGPNNIKSKVVSKKSLFDESVFLAAESNSTFTKLISGGARNSFIVKTELHPILVVYTNPKVISVLKENSKSDKENKVNEDEIPQHLWRHTPMNNYVFSMNLSDKKASLEISKMYILNKSNKFVEFSNEKELTNIKKDTVDGIITREDLMAQIKTTLTNNHFKK
jgi:hypothetical protein